jgi:hypothetical protein
MIQRGNGVFFLAGILGGGFAAPRAVPIRSNGYIAAAGDFNGDGHLDVVVSRPPFEASNDPGRISLLLGDGQGGFTETADTVLNVFTDSWSDPLVAVLDFDDDGRLDLVVTGRDQKVQSNLLLAFLKGDGHGGFAVAAARPVDGGVFSDLAAGDLDGDGKADLLVALGASGLACGAVQLLRGDGQGGFPMSTSFAPGAHLALGDLNGDGRLDVAAACGYGGSVGTQLASGAGGFRPGGSALVGFHGSNLNRIGGVLVGDFDGDGIADLAVGGLDGTALIQGDGRGGLGLPLFVSPLYARAAADLDGDGRPDLVLVDVLGNLYTSRNNCAGAGTAETSFLVPFLLDAPGAGGATFTSDLTLANRGTTTSFLDVDYTASLGGITGRSTSSVAAGIQWTTMGPAAQMTTATVPRSLGFPAQDFGSTWGGTFRVKVSGLDSASDAELLARIRSTTNGTDWGGVAFPGIPASSLLTGPAWIGWLRDTEADRTNLALVNAGDDTDTEIVLRVTVSSTDPAHPGSAPLPDVHLAPGGFTQFDRVLRASGLEAASGYARVERVGGTAPYWAYAVVNDNANADGSIVPPLGVGLRSGITSLTLPVLVESGDFTSELVVTNMSSSGKTVRFEWVADAVATTDHSARFALSLAPGEQLDTPSFVQWLRDRATPGVGAADPNLAGALFVTAEAGDVDGLFVGARTSARGKVGRYGVFYVAVPPGELANAAAWIHGLRKEDASTPNSLSGSRSNLVVVNAGSLAEAASFSIEIFDGDTGLLAGTVSSIQLGPREWRQFGLILDTATAGIHNAYARVSRISGTGPFLAYAVVNDGASPGRGTGDGSFIPMRPEEPR